MTGYSTLTIGDSIQLTVSGRSLSSASDAIEAFDHTTFATVMEVVPENSVKIVDVDVSEASIFESRKTHCLVIVTILIVVVVVVWSLVEEVCLL